MGAARLQELTEIPDWRERVGRVDAWWERRVIDRPVVWMALARNPLRVPWPARKAWPRIRDRWLDAEWHADAARAVALNTEWLGDAVPLANPNLGPEVFSALFGADLEFSPDSSWSVPCLARWEDAGALEFSESNPWWIALHRLTDACLARGAGVYWTGMTDWHPGGDAIAAFRDPETMNEDMIEHRDDILRLLDRMNATFFRVYDHWADLLEAAGQPHANWTRIVSTRRHYVPSNDFSCMISPAMFNETFLPGLRLECRHLERSLYHLDGPDALRHLDALLGIPELSALQWVPGAGRGPASRWMAVYRRAQDAGKAIQILGATPAEVPQFVAALRPAGVWLDVVDVRSRAEADGVLRLVEDWR